MSLENLHQALEQYSVLARESIKDLYEHDERRDTGDLIDGYAVDVKAEGAGFSIEFFRQHYGQYWYRWGHGVTARTVPGYDYEQSGRDYREPDLISLIEAGVEKDLLNLINNINK